MKQSLTNNKHTKKNPFSRKNAYLQTSADRLFCWLTVFLISKKCQFPFWIITTIFSSTVLSFWTKSVPSYKLNRAGTCCLRTKVKTCLVLRPQYYPSVIRFGSPKSIDCEGLGESRTGTRQGINFAKNARSQVTQARVQTIRTMRLL